MRLDQGSEIPLFLQIASSLEDSILSEIYAEESQIPSTTELSTSLMINPATVLKGMNLLVDEGIIYKKRGLGMFVASGAVKKIKEKRIKSFNDSFVSSLIAEAKKLGISKEDIIGMIEGGYKHE